MTPSLMVFQLSFVGCGLSALVPVGFNYGRWKRSPFQGKAVAVALLVQGLRQIFAMSFASVVEKIVVAFYLLNIDENTLIAVLTEVKLVHGDLSSKLSERDGWTSCILSSLEISTVLVEGGLEMGGEGIFDR